MTEQLHEFTDQVRRRATDIGFDLVGIVPASAPLTLPGFHEWLAAGYAGEMHYFGRREAAYSHPAGVLPNVRTVLVVGLNYFTKPGEGSEASSDADSSARVARYARGADDYHSVIRDKLKQLADFLHVERPGCRTRAVVDTAPLLERDFAQQAGLGWFGKNTMLINRRVGSWLFLGALLTDIELVADQPHHTSHCGTCTRCLDACPTDAFVEPYVLDARRCISYLTIELRDDPIPRELRPLMHDWVFGCDVCQEVCPWNRRAPTTSLPEFAPQPTPELSWLLRMDESQFEQRFRPTPLERPHRAGLVRNAAIAAGNTGSTAYVPDLENLLADVEPLVRGAAAWALARLSSVNSRPRLEAALSVETDPDVQEELHQAIKELRGNET